MTEPWLRIKVEADIGAPFIAMFEPSGMTYALDGGQHMFADIPVLEQPREMTVIQWKGGISIWAPGSVITRDADEKELHRLN